MLPIHLVRNRLYPTFLPPEFSPATQPVAVGGDLSAERLLLAYRQGIYPHFNDDNLILWWCPDPRTVLYLDKFKVSQSLRRSIRNRNYRATFNENFNAVIRECANAKRSYQVFDVEPRTWITDNMLQAYLELHALGYAHSVEIWCDDQLVGGQYGVNVGQMFFGESMFHKKTDASKVALFYLVEHLKSWNFTMIDCQVPTPLLLSLGAEQIPRSIFLRHIKDSVWRQQRDEIWTSFSK